MGSACLSSWSLLTGCFYLSEYKSWFTYDNPQEGQTNNTLRFIGKLSNIGGHYDPATGKYTCQYPGLYVFHLNIMRLGSGVFFYCWVRKNGVQKRFWGGSRNASPSFFIHLGKGDEVDIGDCGGIQFRDWSTFSGFLLHAD